MRKPIFTVLAALTAAIAAPAAAAPSEARVVVPFGDLDLTTPAGVTTLEARIAVAVDEVCAKVEPRFFSGEAAWQECKTTSLEDAMAKLAVALGKRNIALAASAER